MIPEDFTDEEYQRIIVRNQFSLRVLCERVALLTRENIELMSIVDELQRDLAESHQILRDLRDSEDMLHPGVTSDHAVVHSVPDEQPVPGGHGSLPDR